MSALEIAELCEALPPNKQEEVANFARFLLARQDDEQWETLIGDAKPRPKLDAFLQRSATEADEKFETNRL